VTDPAPHIRVSDHAVLRWLERGCGVDVEEIRRTIAACCARGIESGAPVIIVGDVKFVIVDDAVVTALSKTMRAKRKKSGRPHPPRQGDG